MNNYKEFNQFEYLKDLDNFEKYEIHLNWDMFKKYHKQELSEYLNYINDEIKQTIYKEKIRKYFNDK